MKKNVIVYVLITTIFILLSACADDTGKIGDIEVDIGSSSIFSRDEIMDAAKVITEHFSFNFNGCTLTHLWYNEEQSENMLNAYMTNGRGSINGVDRKNVIVILSNFDVGTSGHSPSLDSGTTYEKWNWILIRDSKNDSWRVDDSGY